MRIYQFTDKDLDGVSAGVLSRACYGTDALRLRYARYDDLDGALRKFMSDDSRPDGYFRVVITDICPTEPVAKELDEFKNKTPGCELYLFDHHATRSWVNKYEWAVSDSSKCGTLLYFEWLANNGAFRGGLLEGFRHFSELVDVYDRWLEDDPRRKESETLNRLLHFMGFDRFAARFSYDPRAHKEEYLAQVADSLERNEAMHIKKIVDGQCIDNFSMTDSDGLTYCMLVTDRMASQVCHEALRRFPELDYAVNINPAYNTVSVRSRKGGIDASKIARRASSDGGGHKEAAGFPFNARAVLQLALKSFL